MEKGALPKRRFRLGELRAVRDGAPSRSRAGRNSRWQIAPDAARLLTASIAQGDRRSGSGRSRPQPGSHRRRRRSGQPGAAVPGRRRSRLLRGCRCDILDASNLHRQPIYALADVGREKVELALAAVQRINPTVHVEAHARRLDANNALELIGGYDVVVDCSDNFRTKYLINDAAVLARRPAVFASVYQYEGQLQVYKPSPAMPACAVCGPRPRRTASSVTAPRPGS